MWVLQSNVPCMVQTFSHVHQRFRDVSVGLRTSGFPWFRVSCEAARRFIQDLSNQKGKELYSCMPLYEYTSACPGILGLDPAQGNMQITSPITWHWPLGGDPNDGGRASALHRGCKVRWLSVQAFVLKAHRELHTYLGNASSSNTCSYNALANLPKFLRLLRLPLQP